MEGPNQEMRSRIRAQWRRDNLRAAAVGLGLVAALIATLVVLA